MIEVSSVFIEIVPANIRFYIGGQSNVKNGMLVREAPLVGLDEFVYCNSESQACPGGPTVTIPT